MSSNQAKPSFFRRKNMVNLFIFGIACVPLWMFMMIFVKSVGFPEDEAVAFAFTIFFVVGVFAGRYLAMMWAFRYKRIPNRPFIILIIIGVLLLIWLFFYAQFPLRDRYALAGLFFGLPLFAFSCIVGALYKLATEITQRQVTDAKSEAAHSASELQLLQSQISPHFLFNTLNNMYGLSITQHEKLPPLLLKLSELLRYSVYDASKSFVPINDELKYIRNYIEFEKMRIGDRLALSLDVEDFSESHAMIAPMLLIVFIENAFKHSKDSLNEKIYIHMSLKSWGNRILFSIVNSYNVDERKFERDSSGLGLENAKKRLALLYDNDHHLVIEDSDNTYKVMLQIKMK